MNKLKELTEKIQENYSKERTLTMTRRDIYPELKVIMNERIQIMGDGLVEHKRLLDILNAMLANEKDTKIKDALETIVWEKLQQVSITEHELVTMKDELKNIDEEEKFYNERKEKQNGGK